MKDACPIPHLPDFDSKTIKQELQKAVGHIYHRIMTNELALKFNLHGRNNNPNKPPKDSFKKYKELLTVTFGKLWMQARIQDFAKGGAQHYKKKWYTLDPQICLKYLEP